MLDAANASLCDGPSIGPRNGFGPSNSHLGLSFQGFHPFLSLVMNLLFSSSPPIPLRASEFSATSVCRRFDCPHLPVLHIASAHFLFFAARDTCWHPLVSIIHLLYQRY